MNTIKVSRDFSKFPSGRYKSKGRTSGESFREKFIEPAIRNNEEIIIDLDGTAGYGSSFLEEAFGGAIRATNVSSEEFLRIVKLRSENSLLVTEIKQYIRDASKNIL